MEVQLQESLVTALSWQKGAALFGFLGLGPVELGMVCVVAVVLFGNRLPGALRGVGSALRGFREEVRQSVPVVKEVA